MADVTGGLRGKIFRFLPLKFNKEFPRRPSMRSSPTSLINRVCDVSGLFFFSLAIQKSSMLVWAHSTCLTTHGGLQWCRALMRISKKIMENLSTIIKPFAQ